MLGVCGFTAASWAACARSSGFCLNGISRAATWSPYAGQCAVRSAHRRWRPWCVACSRSRSTCVPWWAMCAQIAGLRSPKKFLGAGTGLYQLPRGTGRQSAGKPPLRWKSCVQHRAGLLPTLRARWPTTARTVPKWRGRAGWPCSRWGGHARHRAVVAQGGRDCLGDRGHCLSRPAPCCWPSMPPWKRHAQAEAGQGFAVVAGEVQALAQRECGAAKKSVR